MKRQLSIDDQRKLPKEISHGKRYKLSFRSSPEDSPAESGNRKLYLLQYAFKPVNIDPAEAELSISKESSECKISHNKLDDSGKLDFYGVKSSLESKEMVLQFNSITNEFSLFPIQRNLINLRLKANMDTAETAKHANSFEDKVGKRLSKMISKKQPAKPQKNAVTSEAINNPPSDGKAESVNDSQKASQETEMSSISIISEVITTETVDSSNTI